MKFESYSLEDTYKIATQVAQEFKKKGGVIALSGDLGAGKTTFTQGFAKALGVTDKIISPTFVLIRQHQIPNSKRILYHVDLYRLEGSINVRELGLAEALTNHEDIILIEWAEKIKDQLPKNTLQVDIQKLSENTRVISVI